MTTKLRQEKPSRNAKPPRVAARKTVDKAMQVLNAFSVDEPELGIGELAERLDMHKSIVSRLVAELREWRLIEQDPDSRRVRIGVGAFLLGTLYSNRSALVRASMSQLAALVDRTAHTAHVMIVDGYRALVVATLDSPSALRVIMRVGEYRHLHATAAGKVLLAFGSPVLVEEFIRRDGFLRHTPQTIAAPDELRTALARVRKDGLGWNRGETTPGAGAVAAPIHGPDGAVVAAVSTVYPLSVVDSATRVRIGSETLTAASRISNALARMPDAAAPPAPSARPPRRRAL